MILLGYTNYNIMKSRFRCVTEIVTQQNHDSFGLQIMQLIPKLFLFI